MKIGLTGGIGCGKSTVAGLLAEAGWSVLQADLIVKDLFADDAEVRAALRTRWGTAVFRSDGAVDRRAVARQVFETAEELVWLEELLHPKVRRVWETALAGAPDSYWLVEIPLLFEKKLETKFDSVVCVESTPIIVDNRMVSRGYFLGEVRKRQQRQMPLKQKILRANYVISNSGSLEFLKLQIQQLIKRIKRPV